MKKAAIASLLAVAAVAAAPGMVSHYGAGFAQAPAATAPAAGAPAAGGQIQMDPAEYADYDAATKQSTPQTQAPALEAYLVKYPKSAVKADVQQRIMIAYSQFDHAKAITAADTVLASKPDALQALVIEVAYRREAAEAATDPATKQAGLDAAATYAVKGLAVAKPTEMPQADFDKLKDFATPTFDSAIGTDDLGKKDSAGAVKAFKDELAAMKPDATSAPAALQETYYLGQAYYLSTPPDYLNCTFYTTRAAALAPDQFKPQLQPLATYCYKKYHGGTDGYDAVVTAAKASVTPPDNFSTTVTPAPSAADIAAKTIADTPDLATLALSDKEFILQNGKPEDAEKVFATVKGKNTEIPDATVVVATADQLQVSVSDDAVQGKTADFTYNMKTPLKTVPTVGAKVSLTGTYASYTQSPLMITMSDGEVVTKAAPAKRAPARRR